MSSFLDWWAPKSTLFGGKLGLSIKLVDTWQTHKQVDDHKVIVDGCDLCCVSCPYEPRGSDGYLLIGGYVFSGLREIPDVSDGDEPFEGGRPEKDREGPGRVEEKAAGWGAPGEGHNYILDRLDYAERHFFLVYY